MNNIVLCVVKLISWWSRYDDNFTQKYTHKHTQVPAKRAAVPMATVAISFSLKPSPSLLLSLTHYLWFNLSFSLIHNALMHKSIFRHRETGYWKALSHREPHLSLQASTQTFHLMWELPCRTVSLILQSTCYCAYSRIEVVKRREKGGKGGCSCRVLEQGPGLIRG